MKATGPNLTGPSPGNRPLSIALAPSAMPTSSWNPAGLRSILNRGGNSIILDDRPGSLPPLLRNARCLHIH
jgi:hypothetical protein